MSAFVNQTQVPYGMLNIVFNIQIVGFWFPTKNVLPEFCTIDLTEGGYHLGTFAIMGVTKPTHKSRRYPDGKIQEIKFPEKPQP